MLMVSRRVLDASTHSQKKHFSSLAVRDDKMNTRNFDVYFVRMRNAHLPTAQSPEYFFVHRREKKSENLYEFLVYLRVDADRDNKRWKNDEETKYKNIYLKKNEINTLNDMTSERW